MKKKNMSNVKSNDPLLVVAVNLLNRVKGLGGKKYSFANRDHCITKRCNILRICSTIRVGTMSHISIFLPTTILNKCWVHHMECF